MNKAELIEAMVSKTGHSKKATAESLNAFISVVSEALKAFDVRKRSARISLLFIISSKYSFIFVNSKTTFIMIYKFNYWIIIEKRLTIKSNRIRNIIELSVIIIILFFFIISRKLQN